MPSFPNNMDSCPFPIQICTWTFLKNKKICSEIWHGRKLIMFSKTPAAYLHKLVGVASALHGKYESLVL
jgi:hypothetical protein